MDWTRMFESSHGGKKFGLVFVETGTWLLRMRLFPDKSAISPVEGITWLRNFVRLTTQNNLLELHSDPETSWTVSGRGRDLNTAVVDEYANAVRIIRCPPGTQSTNLTERGQKRVLVLANQNPHRERLGLLPPPKGSSTSTPWRGRRSPSFAPSAAS